MKKYLTLILFFTSCIAYSQDGFETLNGEDYTIKYPATWELNQSGQMGMKFGLFSPVGLYGDQFRENVNLIAQDLTGQDMDLADFVDLSENQIRTMMANSDIIESKKVNDFHKLIYTGTMGRYKLKFQQYYWVVNGSAYILTFTAERSEYDNYIGVAQQIMDSFQLK